MRPCLRELREAFALPSGDDGPWDFWAFSRLAARRASEMVDSVSFMMLDSCVLKLRSVLGFILSDGNGRPEQV